MEPLSDVIFYSIDKAIKTYRQYAQKQLKNAGYSITIDQWLVIKTLLENPHIKQQDLGEKTFKDNASITRIIELLENQKLRQQLMEKGRPSVNSFSLDLFIQKLKQLYER